ncbi:MAG TPA: ATP-grasp domain-containing protein, partial [Desulfobacteraceae bacterium]|nr:ATP-grasp domain-containing protein [Desulfobacteraceae bacterium]
DKIKQTAIFKLLDIPHPRTRVFYGKHQKTSILDHFQFPFIAKIPRGSSMGRGVFLIQDHTDLHAYLSLDTPAYIQEYLQLDRDMRVVVIGREIAHAYWRITAMGEFRSNIAAGASISLEPVLGQALALALHTAKTCGWNDVGIDICSRNGKLYVLEANMKYGKEGFRTAGIDYADMMANKIAAGAI